MNLKHLIDKYSWKDIQPKFLELYPEEEEKLKKYSEVYDQLKNFEIKGGESKMRIVIDKQIDEIDEFYYDVSGVSSGDETKYGLAETSWKIWLKMEIDSNTLSQIGDMECLIHCLWEMTFSSLDQ
ncbi:MAG: DUF6557 family protein [Candidatus Hodarchaeales archaeon]|jgi:hypothetical protein